MEAPVLGECKNHSGSHCHPRLGSQAERKPKVLTRTTAPSRQSYGFFPSPVSHCQHPAERCLGTTASRCHCPVVPTGQEGRGGFQSMQDLRNRNTGGSYSKACGAQTGE